MKPSGGPSSIGHAAACCHAPLQQGCWRTVAAALTQAGPALAAPRRRTAAPSAVRRAPRAAAAAQSSSDGSNTSSGGGGGGPLPLRETQQQQQWQQPAAAAASPAADGKAAPSSGPPGGAGGVLAAGLGVVGGIAALACGGYVFRGPISQFLQFFITAVEQWGVWGHVAYILVYTGLEILALPAIPLTMTAGAIFGPAAGVVVVSIGATLAATAAFLISRYLARDKILSIVQRNKRFAAVDRAISRDGLKFVTLLRLSPLLPLALSNYMYGLTSVDLRSYIVGSLIGMLPGTYAYVTAGHLGRAILMDGGGGSLSVAPWQVGIGVAASLLAITFIGQLAKRAIEEADAEEAAAAAAAGGGGGDNGTGAAPQAA